MVGDVAAGYGLFPIRENAPSHRSGLFGDLRDEFIPEATDKDLMAGLERPENRLRYHRAPLRYRARMNVTVGFDGFIGHPLHVFC